MEEIRGEEWLPVVNYEGFYEVSNLGSVRSLSRMTRGRWDSLKLSKGRYLKPYLMNTGYLRVDLSKKGVTTSFAIHRLVGKAFIPLIEGKNHINHIDNNRANNHVSNLEWCTPKENTAHASKQGRLGAILNNNSRKTHCKNGHPLYGSNLYTTKQGYRQCKICVLNRMRLHREKIKATKLSILE